MPQEPYIFKSETEAITIIQRYAKTLKSPYNEIPTEQIIINSVTSNIFRAFSLRESKGSQIYRNWARENISSLERDLQKVRNQKVYNAILVKYTNSFINYWEKQTIDGNEKIGYGPASKMINLLIKQMQESAIYRNERIYPFMHVPFDYYTLLPLKNIINEISGVPYKIIIPQNASMSFIVNKELYDVFTSAYFRLAKKAKVHPIVFDYWCWNRTHKKL